jgi:hypothetical protein
MPEVQRLPDAVHVVGVPPPPARPPTPPARPAAPVSPPPPAGVKLPQQISPTAPHFVPLPSSQEPLLQVPVVPLPPMQAEPLA